MVNNAWGGQDVMLSGGIVLHRILGPVLFRGLDPGRGNGINSQHYFDQVLRLYIVAFFKAHRKFVFQRDNARSHRTSITQDFLQRNSMAWPALNLDLNPIEHFRDRFKKRAHKPTTAAELH